MRNFSLIAITFWATLLLPAQGLGFGLTGATLSARPAAIKAGLFFEGQTVTLAGQKPTGQPLLILVVGPQQEQTIANLVKQQGIWVTGEQQTLESAPGFLATAATGPLTNLFTLFSESLRQSGLTGMTAFVSETQPGSTDDWHRAYGDLLARHSLMVTDLPLKIDEKSGHFSTSVRLPSNAPPGNYQVSAFTLGGGQTLALTASFGLTQSGIARHLQEVAFQQPVIYGVAALLFAMLVGWLIGALFNRR